MHFSTAAPGQVLPARTGQSPLQSQQPGGSTPGTVPSIRDPQRTTERTQAGCERTQERVNELLSVWQNSLVGDSV